MTRAALTAAALMCAVIGATHSEQISGPVAVIDGDTIIVGDKHIRLAGIDAPEIEQTCHSYPVLMSNPPQAPVIPCGQLAAEKLAGLATGRVLCDDLGRDRYDRTVGRCWNAGGAGRDIGEEMVLAGWAVRDPKYDRDCSYCEAEAEARRKLRGLWAGEFTMPWTWRRERQHHR